MKSTENIKIKNVVKSYNDTKYFFNFGQILTPKMFSYFVTFYNRFYHSWHYFNKEIGIDNETVIAALVPVRAKPCCGTNILLFVDTTRYYVGYVGGVFCYLCGLDYFIAAWNNL